MTHPTLEATTPAATLVAVDGRTYPLESARILARAQGGIATSTLAQSYANPYDEPLEVIYTLPLPADGAVLGYTIRIGDKVIRAEVQPREKATKAYRDALFEGRTAGLLEQTRPDTFQQKLGNVPPRTKVEITIDVLHPLAFMAAEDPDAILQSAADRGTNDSPFPDTAPRAGGAQWEYRFPTVTGVRYHGDPARTPDHAQLSPDRDASGGIPVKVELALAIADPFAGQAGSPSHAVRVAPGEDATVVTFHEGERLDRDVVVRWTAASQAVGAHVVEGAGLPGDDGRYALVTLVPPQSPRATLARDLTVLLDASGSMSGVPLELARRVVGELLRSVGGNDRFELFAFSDQVKRLTGRMSAGSPRNVRKAVDALAHLQANGGTEMASAVTEALEPLRTESQRQVVLVTDGYVGFEADVVGRIAATRNVRLHVVGVGSAPNRSLTQQAAAAGRGLELLAGDTRTADEAGRRLVAGTAGPVLTNVGVGGSAVTGGTPGLLRDVFAGQPLVFTLELGRAGGTLELRGDLAGSSEPWELLVDVPAAGAASGLAATPMPIGALHGRSLVAALEIELAGSRGDTAGLEPRIESLGMRHRIASRCTSLVAIAEEPAVDPRAPRRRERLAVELPANVSAEGVGLAASMGAAGRPMLATMMAQMKQQLRRTPSEVASAPTMRMESEELGRTSAPPAGHAEPRMMRGIARTEDLDLNVEHVRWLEPDLIVIEFAVPLAGIELGTSQVLVLWIGPAGQAVRARGRVDAAHGSGPGPHEAGRIVRVAIRLDSPATWPAGVPVSIETEAKGPGAWGRPSRMMIRASVTVPAAPDHMAAGEGA